MRPRVVIVCILAIVGIALLVLWHRPAISPGSSPHEIELATTNKPIAAQAVEQVSAQVIVVPSAPMSATGVYSSVLSNALNPSADRMMRVEQAENQWRTPINFYGMVVDENTNVVAGADISFSWTDLSPEGSSSASTTSDANGSFLLEGKTGKHLSVQVTKTGYYTSKSNVDSYFYAGQNENFNPNPNVPVIFHLRKKHNGESLISTDYPGFAHIAQLRHDGTPVELDLFHGTQVAAGSGQLNLMLDRDVSNLNANIFNWKLQISAPGGGLIRTDEEFDFQAPLAGYVPVAVIDMPATNVNWQSELRSKFYIQFSNGDFGRIDLYFLAFNGVFTVHSTINPSGSRNLEQEN